MKKVYLVLDNLRSIHNVGSIFRTADAAGVSKIFLVGTTPTPIDRFGRESDALKKVALGAEKTVEWEYFKTAEDALEQIDKSISLISVEQTENSKGFDEINPEGDMALVFGNEVDGVSETFLSASDHILEIPMHGQKESLNVSVSVGIVLFHFNK